MSSVSLLGDTSGSVLLQAPAIAGSPTVTLPSITGTLNIPQADQWCMTSTVSNATSQVLSANWSRMAPAGFAKIGNGMTQSSGVFTFPTTGLYLITGQARFYYDSARRYVQIFIETTINNSTWAVVGLGSAQLYNTGADSYATAQSQAFLNVTDTSLCKVRFSVDCQTSTNVYGTANRNDTGATFIRLGEAQ